MHSEFFVYSSCPQPGNPNPGSAAKMHPAMKNFILRGKWELKEISVLEALKIGLGRTYKYRTGRPFWHLRTKETAGSFVLFAQRVSAR